MTILAALRGSSIHVADDPQARRVHFRGLARRVSIDGEVLHVRGDLDSYRVLIATGSVFRESDGRQIFVDVEGFRSAPMAGVDFGGVGDVGADFSHGRGLE